MKPLRNNILVRIEERDVEGDVFSRNKERVFIAEAIGDEVKDVKVGDELYIKLVNQDEPVVNELEVLAI